VTIWAWLKLTAALWLIRKGFKAFGWLLVAAAAIAAWPLTAVAGIGYLAAWLRGWPPARLWHAAAWALPMTVIYAIGQALHLRRGRRWPWPRSMTGTRRGGCWPATPCSGPACW
jgi:hypothetical protein